MPFLNAKQMHTPSQLIMSRFQRRTNRIFSRLNASYIDALCFIKAPLILFPATRADRYKVTQYLKAFKAKLPAHMEQRWHTFGCFTGIDDNGLD